MSIHKRWICEVLYRLDITLKIHILHCANRTKSDLRLFASVLQLACNWHVC